MDRYVAFLWDSTIEPRTQQVDRWSAQLKAQSSKWTTVLDLPGLRVHSLIHRGDAPIVTGWPDNNGVIIGPLFRRGDERKGRVKQLSTTDAEHIEASEGDALVSDWWGNYVAIWRKRGDNGAVVIRDPCGAVPCFMSKQQHIDMFFAHAEDVASLPDVSFSIDWTYLQAFVYFHYFITKHTGLKEVTELLAGERLAWSRHRTQNFSWVWNAARIAAAPSKLSFQDAIVELRDTAMVCFTAWGNEYRRPLVSLSGGLDSSILLNLIRIVSDIDPVAVHYRGFGFEYYETELARLAAKKAGVELIETQADLDDLDVQVTLKAERTARPKLQALATQIDSRCARIADQVSSDSFMLGHGGDNLFLRGGIATHTLTDYLRMNGADQQFWPRAYEAARLRQRSISSVLAATCKTIFAFHSWAPYEMLGADGWAKHRPIRPDVIRSLPEDYRHHPWINDARSLPTGKADHLVQIISLYNYHLHHGRGLARDVIYPYFSQPITEFVLRMPTYLLAQGGIDRALEREAFADVIPSQVARRVGKGSAVHYSLLTMQKNAKFYSDMILNGEIIQRDWLDIDQLNKLLSSSQLSHGGGALFTKLIATAEVWIATWKHCAIQRAA